MSKPYRIAVGGLHIECSEFTPYRSGEAAFRVRRGQELLDSHPWITGDTSAIDASRLERFGAIERVEGVEWVPLTYAGALPGGPVTNEFFNAWLDEFCALLEQVHKERPLDAVLLTIHGAASVVGVEDGEGVVASRVRQIVGKDVPIAASMDLHGCISDLLFESCDLLTCYRTAPHIDVPWTHERAARALVKVLDNPERTLYRARVNVPVLLPGEKTSTEVEPGASMYAKLGVYQLQDDVFDTSIWMGFPWADMERCHGTTPAPLSSWVPPIPPRAPLPRHSLLR